MNKLSKLALFAAVGTSVAFAFADSNPGYVSSGYGKIVKTAYGQCVHTAYFDKNSDGVDECGEGKPKPLTVAPVITYEVVKLSDEDTILFTFNSYQITQDGQITLGKVLDKINSENDVSHVQIDGYTDVIGSDKDNLVLSTNRANSVKAFFVSKGYPQDKIDSQGLGEKEMQISHQCIDKLGNDPYPQIVKIQNQLKHVNVKTKLAKSLHNKLDKLKAKRVVLIKCMAPDRKVVFTIEHTAKVPVKPQSSMPMGLMPVDAGEVVEHSNTSMPVKAGVVVEHPNK